MVKIPSLAGEELRSFDPVPAGTYRVSVDRAEERMSSNNNPGIMWLFKISEVVSLRQLVDEPEQFINRTIVHGTSLTDSSLWNIYRTLIALGDDPDSIKSGDLDLDLDEYIGKECVIDVSVQEYPADSGTYTNRVNNLRALKEEEVGRLA